MANIRTTTIRGKKVRMLVIGKRRLRADRIFRAFMSGSSIHFLAVACINEHPAQVEDLIRWYLNNPKALRAALKGGRDG